MTVVATGSDFAAVGSALALADRAEYPDLSLLVVSRSARWARAVRSATEEFGDVEILTCDARDALRRLAGSSTHYSHLLVDRNDSDGLLQALADLAIEIACPDIGMLMLGVTETGLPHVRPVPAASARAVRDALMAARTRDRLASALALTDLRAALDGAMIDTRYQPIIRMADRRPIGLEALARLIHPVAGTLLPDQFVPQMEHAGLGQQLTQRVSARVFADLLSPALAGTGLRVSVNFPLDVLLAPGAVDRLEEQRAASGIPANRIIVELTESQPVQDVITLRRSLDQLRTLGYGAAIDDVGPGVPDVASLLDLPFTSLKLDKDLVVGATRSPDTEQLVAATIAQARHRGMTVVAEGVETEEIWARMLALGADEAQGFLAARPLPLAAVPIWLAAWSTTPI